jgi:hemerythrin-like domain-containing protein
MAQSRHMRYICACCMAIQIGAKPSPTFEQPIELLSDCHRRVESFLKALIVVTNQRAGGDLSTPQRDALQTALRYFREAAPKHTADEEESLFPQMRSIGSAEAEAALAKIAALEADHEAAEPDHALVEALGQKWLEQNELQADEVSQLRQALHRLQQMYERHIAIEDNEVFPLAKRVLDKQRLDQVGREMAARRGARFQGFKFV